MARPRSRRPSGWTRHLGTVGALLLVMAAAVGCGSKAPNPQGSTPATPSSPTPSASAVSIPTISPSGPSPTPAAVYDCGAITPSTINGLMGTSLVPSGETHPIPQQTLCSFNGQSATGTAITFAINITNGENIAGFNQDRKDDTTGTVATDIPNMGDAAYTYQKPGTAANGTPITNTFLVALKHNVDVLVAGQVPLSALEAMMNRILGAIT